MDDELTIAERKALQKFAQLDEHERALTDEQPLERKDGFFITVCVGCLIAIWIAFIKGWVG